MTCVNRRVVGVLMACALAACSNANTVGAPTSSTQNAFAVSSKDLASGRWPSADTCDGGDNVPELHWTAGPPGTASYALQLFDPDAPRGGFTHWMLVNEPPDLREPTPGTGVSGKNDFGNEGYNGPCPPKGTTHRYVFTVYAVDTLLSLNRLYRPADFQRALQGHVLAQATVGATYSR